MKVSSVQRLPSDRSFGMTFAGALALLSAWLLWRGHARWASTTAGTLAALFFVLGWVAPRVLRPLNALWMKIGVVMNAVVSPVVLGALYLGIFTPYALVMRLRGRDALRRSFDPAAPTYWLARNHPGADGKRRFDRQF
jgi:predicted membrane metal-binding protein